MKRYLIVGVLAVLFVISLSAAENAKIKLPDGLYMYDSWIAHLTNGDVSVRFEKFFVVQKNSIYSSQEAIRKFGTAHLMIANKTYKILFGGEQIGEIHIVNIDDDEHVNYKEEFLTKNIKRGPAYCEESIYIGRLGSVARHLAVPEKYKVLRPISFKEISKEEVDKISRLAKDKLFHLVKNRKELKRCRIIETKLVREKMELLDKISVGNNEMYIGIYKFAFGSADKALGLCEFDVLFYVKEGNIYAITSDHDDETLFGGEMKIQGILDVDGCGEGEVIMEKLFTGEAGPTINLEIYKQKADGNWTQITRIKARRAL